MILACSAGVNLRISRESVGCRTNGSVEPPLLYAFRIVGTLVEFASTNDVLLFSDKDCAYQSNFDVSVAWPRWYRNTIDKSVRQLVGAEKFIKAFPKRIFLDKACQALPAHRAGVSSPVLVC